MRIVTYLLGGALLFSTVTANAMPIPQYDSMSAKDEGTYVALLVKGALKGLHSHGQDQQAEKLTKIFSDYSPQGGVAQFEKNLQIARALNLRNAADPTNKQPPYEVENALAVTLKDNGITVPVSFLLTINRDFKPSATTTPHK